MDTPRYKTIISVLNSSNEGFDEYIEMSKRISLFVETDGASEANGMMEESYVAQYTVLQDILYKQALEKEKERIVLMRFVRIDLQKGDIFEIVID